MSELLEDKKIRIVKAHAQGEGGHSTEIIIPKEFCTRYGFAKDVHVMLIPEEDYLKVMKLRVYAPEEKTN